MNGTLGYSLTAYRDMIMDAPRMDAYARALRRVLPPNQTLVDMGAGTGILALLACQLGAKHVHAIEPNNAIHVAQTIAAANGYADRITFHQALSTSVSIPVRVDVIVSDLRGVVPFHQHHIRSIMDACCRLLAPDGRLIPQKDTLWAALVEAPELYQPYVQPWLCNNFGLDISAGHQLAVNLWRRVCLRPTQMLTQARPEATLDYRTIETADLKRRLTWTPNRAGTVHGIAVWFDAELVDGIDFSNAPDGAELISGQAFFPLQEPVELTNGDEVEVQLYANLVDADYVWRWDTRITDLTTDSPKAQFQQSTFFATPFSPSQLRKTSSDYVPFKNENGRLQQMILELMNGSNTVGEIAAQILSRFPDQFSDWQHALAYAGKLSRKFSR